MVTAGFERQEKITDEKVDDLAGMVKRGFDKTARKEDLEAVRQDLEVCERRFRSCEERSCFCKI